MVRNKFLVGLLVATCLVSGGCGNKSADSGVSFEESQQTLQEEASKLPVSGELPVLIENPEDGVNVDLTKIDSSVSGAMSAILNNTDKYFGKTIKVSGVQYNMTSGDSGKSFHYIELNDGKGMDSMLVEVNSLSGNYAPDGTQVEITGKLVSYSDGGLQIYRLEIE